MPNILRMSKADLERHIENRARDIHDSNRGGGDPAPIQTRPPEQHQGTHADDIRMGGNGGLTRGLGMFSNRRPNVSNEECVEIMNFFRDVYAGDQAGAKRRLANLGQRATQNESDDAAGGIFVPAQMVNEILIELPKFTPFADRNITRIFPMSSLTAKFPKVKTKPDQPDVIQEEGAYGKTRALFGHVELVARKVGEIIPMTEEILQDSSIEMVQLLTELVAEQLANKRNYLVTNGNGVSEPEGIRTNANVTTKAWVATSDATKADSLIAIFHALPSQYRRDCIWLIHDSIVEVIRKLKDANNRYLWTDGFAAAPPTILGRPVFENPDIPTDLGAGSDESEIHFGNFRRGYVIGTRRGLEVERNSSGTDWEQDIVNLKFRERYDGKILDEKAFVRGTGVK